MKWSYPAAALFLSFALCHTEMASGGGKEKIVAARVNGVEITTESVTIMMNSPGMKRGHETASSKGIEEAKRAALDQLILQELAYQKAKSEGWTVDPKEIDDAMIHMGRKPGGGGESRDITEKDRIPEEELRKRIERNLTVRRIITREVRNKVSVSEEDVRKEYEREKESYARPEKTVVVDVVFFLEPGEADSRVKAEETLKKINEDKEKNPWNLVSGGDFAVREMEVSEGQEKEVYEAAKNLKVGELSGVFAAGGNLHIIRLKEYSPFKQFTFEEVKGRIEADMRSRALKKRLAEWEAELKQGAKIEIME